MVNGHSREPLPRSGVDGGAPPFMREVSFYSIAAKSWSRGMVAKLVKLSATA